MEKTGILSIRLYADEKENLIKESKKKNMTVNALGRQIISKHIAWHRYAKDLGYTCVSKSLLQTLFQNAGDDIIENLSKNTPNILKNTVVFIHGEVTIDNIISVLDDWLSACHISFRHFTDFHIEKYVISHNMGKRFSDYIGMSINSVLNETGYMIKNTLNDESRITFEIERNEK